MTRYLLLQLYHIEILEQALACPQIWDTTNGVTLCSECHRANEVDDKIRAFTCKDCDELFGGREGLMLHQHRTGHRHSKKLGEFYSLPPELRRKLQYFD